ncbi:MAG: hypothetical protein RIC51_03605 [Erythrobacter sp.]|uniref:hypothetical protein n=1 Tax=Erythrobacter sp. TaxID=1042 RepID=UPI0032ECDD78
MTVLAFIAPLALLAQAGPPPEEAPAGGVPLGLEGLELEQAAALRCAVAFAVVSGWQGDGDERGAAYPDLAKGGGREFFVRTMARLMDECGLDRAGVLDLVALQSRRFRSRPGTIAQIMPACLMMKRSAGL